MGLKIETWNIAFRKKNNAILFDRQSPFTVINNGHKGWYADPFLFDYKGETYLFAEFFSYKFGRGVISYSKYSEKENNFGDFKEIIVEDFHLSYPVVFYYRGSIYMMPETSETNSLYLYKSVSFPDRWERLQAVFTDAKLVDTTPFLIKDNLYAITLKLDEKDHSKGGLLLLEFDGEKFNQCSDKIVTKDMSIARPGGNFVEHNSKIYRVSQDCSGTYGKAINFIEVSNNYFKNSIETLYEKILPNDLKLFSGKTPSGIHTYNSSKKLEVIDLKYYKNSFYRVMLKIFRRGNLR